MSDAIQRFNRVLDEASKRHELKELVWKVYQDPELVKAAIEALTRLTETPDPDYDDPCSECGQ